MFTVYCHTSKTNGKKYIGITSMSPIKRWNNGHGYEKNKKFYQDIQRYGWDGFAHTIIAENLSRADAVTMESNLIAKYETVRNGYNNHSGGRYGKKGNLSPHCTRIKNTLKRFSQTYPNYVVWYDFFCKADTLNESDGDLANRINLYTEAIFKKHDWFEEYFEDIFGMNEYIYELNYCFKLEQFVEKGGKFPEYLPYAKMVRSLWNDLFYK